MKLNHRKAITMAAIIALALSVGMAHAALAQEGSGHGPGPGFAKELNLTADQQAKVKQIMEQNHASMKAIRDDQSLTPEQRHQKMSALHESMKTQMDAILTPEQQQKMAQMHEGRGGMGGPGGHAGMMGMAKELNLTADQQTKVKSIMESTHQQMRTIEQNQSLSKQDKQAQIKQLHESTKTQISALLTPDQQQKFAQMHEHMGKGGRGHGHHPSGSGGQQDNGAQQPPPGI
jgi:Spy/CpxP family protein refolding chaperone